LKRFALIGALLWLGTTLPLAGQINEKRNLSETNHRIFYAGYSPSGEYVATTGSDNNIIIWKAGSWIIHRTLVGLKRRPNQVVFSKSGRTLYSAGEDGAITTWDLTLVKITGSVAGHTGAINALAINPRGTILASVGEDKVARVWSIHGENLELVYELKGHKKTITTAAISPDGKTLATGGADRKLILWDLRTGGVIRETEAHQGWIRCLRYSPGGQQICTGGDDRMIRIWDAGTLAEIKVLEGHTGWVQTLAYTPSGRHIISGGHDATVRVWDVDSGKTVAVSEKLEQIVLSVDASPVQNDFISSCLLSENLRIWANKFEEGQLFQASSTSKESSGEQSIRPDQGSPPLRETAPSTDHNTADAGKPAGTDAEPGAPVITLFSPSPENGRAVHGGTSILIIGKAEGEGGIQTLLVNRQRAELSDAGVFQAELPLQKGDNHIVLVAVSRKGKMSSYEMVVHCTNDAATGVAEQPVSGETGRYYALIIGIDDYADDEIPDLDYPIQDADSLYETLVREYIFSEEDITLLKNPTRTDMIIAMDELSQEVTDKDNLLIFYAGHGFWDEKSGIGYWLPCDAARSNSTLRDFIGSIHSRHTLLIADACFSGSIFKTRGVFPEEDQGIRKLQELPSRKAMTSGALKEVPDQSVFVRYLIRELKQNKAKFLPSEALFSSFKTAVLNNSPNVPQYGTIQNVGDEGGDFVFIRK
jgi:WD40 repeat protein